MSRSATDPSDSARGGVYICVPFETADESLDASVAFIHGGLSRGFRCLFIGTSDEYRDLGVALEGQGICALRAAARGALVYMTAEQAYLEDGVFNPPHVLAR